MPDGSNTVWVLIIVHVFSNKNNIGTKVYCVTILSTRTVTIYTAGIRMIESRVRGGGVYVWMTIEKQAIW